MVFERRNSLVRILENSREIKNSPFLIAEGSAKEIVPINIATMASEGGPDEKE